MKKIFSALLCFAILLTFSACASKSQSLQSSQETQGSHKTKVPQTQVQNNHPKEYDDIISEYIKLLTAKHKGEVLPAPNTFGMDDDKAAIAEAIYSAVLTGEEAQKMGYAYKDMDSNGIPELFLLTSSTAVRAIFTISQGNPILLDSHFEQGHGYWFTNKNRFFTTRKNVTDAIGEVTHYTCHVEGDKMVYDSVYGEVYDQEQNKILERFQIIDGNRMLIDDDTFKELSYEHRKFNQANNILPKMNAPRIYLPLADKISTEGLPTADFSNYTAIRDTYVAISTCLDTFSIADWVMRQYDNLFSYPNDLSFEYYNKLLYNAYHGNYNVGYDEIDLNGDGQDELVLLNENYSIKAIFTKKNGVPVLLDAFSYETCWLDDQGMIHIDREDYDELEYSLYHFTKEGDYKLVYSILAAANGKRYLTKDNKTTVISFEESLPLYYDEYCCYSEPFSPNEYTRNVSELTYTPLTTTEDPLQATAKQWEKNAELSKTMGEEYGAYGNTKITFTNVTDTQMDVHFQYTYTFFYPDPNQEHYLLDDSTESFLNVTARMENGNFVFDENGIKGRLEFYRGNLWLIIEESTDERFFVGSHCFEEYSPDKYI